MRLALALAATLFALSPARAEDAPPPATGDAEAGKAVFAKCAVCHNIGPDAKNKIGPELNGVVGRKPGSIADFSYSKGMQDFGAANPAWTEDLLSQYLENPRTMVPGNKMAFIGLKKPEDRANVIAYLKTNPAP